MSALGEGAGRPSERICPDADTNFKFSVDQICGRAYREIQAQNQKKKSVYSAASFDQIFVLSGFEVESATSLMKSVNSYVLPSA
jgi:hypothetical protein